MGKHVKFLGQLKKSEVESVLKSTDLTILTSYSEGFPLTLLESARQKTPFISTDVGDIKKLVPDESYGWLIEPENANAISRALEQAYKQWNEGFLKEKGEKVYHLVANNFSLKKMCSQTKVVYLNTKK